MKTYLRDLCTKIGEELRAKRKSPQALIEDKQQKAGAPPITAEMREKHLTWWLGNDEKWYSVCDRCVILGADMFSGVTGCRETTTTINFFDGVIVRTCNYRKITLSSSLQ